MAKGQVDPTHLSCDCPQDDSVLLFYRYFAADPVLDLEHAFLSSQGATPATTHEEDMARFQLNLCTSLELRGKVRCVWPFFPFNEAADDSIYFYQSW